MRVIIESTFAQTKGGMWSIAAAIDRRDTMHGNLAYGCSQVSKALQCRQDGVGFSSLTPSVWSWRHPGRPSHDASR